MAHSGGFDMNEEDEAFEDLEKRQGDWGMQGSRKHQILRYAENVESKGTSTTQEEIDILWQKAMQDSIKDGEMYTRYRFAKLVAEKALAEQAMQAAQRLWTVDGTRKWAAGDKQFYDIKEKNT